MYLNDSMQVTMDPKKKSYILNMKWAAVVRHEKMQRLKEKRKKNNDFSKILLEQTTDKSLNVKNGNYNQ